jgi:hypothetical protein
MSTIYAGPGKVFINAIALQAEGENGTIKLDFKETTAEYAAAMFGRIGEQTLDQTIELTVKPFDNWGSIGTLFPPRIGVTSAAGAAALVIGSRPHGLANASTKVWTPDGRLYNLVRSAVTGHPSLHLGIGKALFGDAKILAIGDGITPVLMGAAGYLVAGNSITESAAADPGGAMTMADFIRGAWIGVWGAVAGFGAVEAEEEWTIETSVKYSPLKVQGRTVGTKVDSVGFMAKVRPFGPTQTQILAAVGAHTQGQRLGSADLVLTGPSAKTITLENAEIKGAGFEFGGTTLGNGEIGFVNEMQFTAGVPGSLLTFSA